MNALLIIPLIFLVLTLFLIVFAAIILRKKILSFLYPHDYAEIEMIEKDNNTRIWLEKKKKDLTFNFNEGSYNMFEVTPTEDPLNNPPPYLITSVYRAGRLAKFFYLEGESNPIDMRTLKIHHDAQQTNQLEKIRLSRLIHSNVSLGSELWNKYGFFLIIGVIILLLYLAFKK